MATWLNPVKKATATTAATLRPTTVAPAMTTQDFFGRTPNAVQYINPISLPKVPGADPLIMQAFSDYGTLRGNTQGDLSKFRAGVEGSQGQVGQYAAGDIAELDRIFGPTGYESDLGNIRRTRQAAMANLNDTLLGDLKRALSLNSRGGTAGTGLGSYLSRQAASEAGKIRAQAAVDDATQARADLAALMSARTGSIGRRQSVTDALLSRLLAPADKEMGAQSGLNAQLQSALNAALANLVSAYGMKAY